MLHLCLRIEWIIPAFRGKMCTTKRKTEEKRMLNRKFEGATLFEIDYTPKGTTEMKTVKVWAKNRLDASNYMILNHIWGKQHEIRFATANFLK